MKILCVIGSENFFDTNNSTTIINTNVLKGLKELNHIIDLVTVKSTENDFLDQTVSSYINNFISIDVSKSKKKNKENLHASKIKNVWLKNFKIFLSRPYSFNDLKLDNKYDLLLVMCPSALAVVISEDIIKVNKFDNIKTIQYWSDPIAGALLDYTGKIPLKRLPFLCLERLLIKNADEIVYITQPLYSMQTKLHKKSSEKMRWIDVAYLENNKKEVEKRNIDVLKLGYFGSYNSKVRNIIPLLECMEHHPTKKLLVRGDTDIEQEKWDYVDIEYERKTLEDIKRMEDEVHILVCLGNLRGVQIPGKTFYYGNYNKPIIYIADGLSREEITMYLKSYNRYIICENNTHSINEAIIKAKSVLTNENNLKNIGYSPKTIAKKIIEN